MRCHISTDSVLTIYMYIKDDIDLDVINDSQ